MKQIVFLLAAIVGLEHCIHNSVFAREPLAKASNPILKFLPGLKKTKPLQEDVKSDLHKSKVKELLLAESYLTGYDEKSPNTSNSYSSTPFDIVQEKIDSAYKRVKCGYIFNAKMHLLLTGDLLEQKNVALVRKLLNINDISYDKEVIWMIHTLMSAGNINMNEVWLMYAYSNSVRTFFENIQLIKNNGSVIDPSEIRDAHEYVLDRLESFTDHHCEKDNVFDIKSESCKIAVELRDAQKQTSGGNTGAAFIPLIVANKKCLRKIVEYNVNNGMRVDVGFKDEPLFQHKDLFFRDKFGDTGAVANLIAVFTDNFPIWKASVDRLKSLEEKSRRLGPRGWQSLGVYQRYVLDLLKAIVLQITWKHLLYLDGSYAVETRGNLIDSIIAFEINLAEFVDFVGLEHDDFFKSLIEKLRIENIKADFKTKTSEIVNIVKAQLTVICARLQVEIKEPSDLDTVSSSKSFDKIKKFTIYNLDISYYKDKYYGEHVKRTPVLDTLFAIDVLNGYMQYLFTNKFPFVVIRSFNKMTEELKNQEENW